MNAIVSPCSVMRRRAAPCGGGCARIARCVGPPPRPVLPPRPWKTVSTDVVCGGDLAEPDERLVDRPLRREEAAVLGRVRVPDHHGHLASALVEPRARAWERAAARRGSRGHARGRRSSRTAVRPRCRSPRRRRARTSPARRRRSRCRTARPCRAPRDRARPGPRGPRRASRAARRPGARTCSAWTRTSSRAMCSPNTATRRRSAASRPSAMRAPTWWRRLCVDQGEVGRELRRSRVSRLVPPGELVVEPPPDRGQLAAVRLVAVPHRGLVVHPRQLALVCAIEARSSSSTSTSVSETPIARASSRTSSR